MIHRYLRIYFMTPKGHLLGDDSIVSNVLMPAMPVPGTTFRAGTIALVSSKRRAAAASALTTELRRRPPRYLGVGLLLCEAARSGQGATAHRFVASCAVLGADHALFVADIAAPTLPQALGAMAENMLDILREADAYVPRRPRRLS